MTAWVVSDSSALVAMLLDGGSDGQWATQQLSGSNLSAPDLISYESANIIRRHERAGLITSDQASQAHADLLQLTIEVWPYDVLAPRVWELRRNLTVYDASYVAVAEQNNATLVTLDAQIARVPGLRCAVLTPGRG